ncbi:caveolin-2 [Oncorhynchus mykiss]|uniref:Caveolin n=2 Tax=Oncorhynchus mykiss TaxID=8022 RepID=A0A8C7QI70_ONCMY|nr:caveolin-2 [Oncorhynchus mykiss]
MTFACCVYYPTLRCFPRGAWVRFRCARHGHSSKCKERSQLLTNDSSTPLTASQDCQVKMGLEKVNYETSIIMDEDEFNRSIEPILSKNDKVYAAIPDRDPNDINAHLKVGFDDVIAEPSSSHSFDKVWIGSHAVFELVKYGFYLILTTILAVPMAFILGIVFGVFSCVHIWVLMPGVRSCLMALPSVQVVWSSLTDMLVSPLFHSMGRCLSSVHVKTTDN